MKEIGDEERASIIETGLASEFWREVLYPLCKQRVDAMLAALRDPSLMRKHKLPDNYVRGQLDFAEMLLNQPALLRESIRTALAEERLAEFRDKEDSLIAHFGRGAIIED